MRAPAPVGVALVRFFFGTLGLLAPALMSRWAYRLWFKTRRFPLSPQERRVQTEAERVPFTSNNKPLAVFTWGRGPTVLLVHGWHGYAMHFSAFVEPLVQAGFRVVAFDAPAHGESPGRQTTLFEIADAITALAQYFGPVHTVITHSFGTPCATYALTNGAEVSRIVCISPPLHLNGLVKAFSGMLRLPAPVLQHFRLRLERAFGQDVWERLSPHNHARTLSLPALFFHDAGDRAVPVEDGEALAQAWRGSRFVRTEGLGHRRILSDPRVIRQCIAFLTEG